MGSELNGQGKAQFHCRDCSDLAKTISPAMNLRVIKSLATPSCSLVFAPAMGISTSSDRKSGNQQRTTAINHHHLNIHHRKPTVISLLHQIYFNISCDLRVVACGDYGS